MGKRVATVSILTLVLSILGGIYMFFPREKTTEGSAVPTVVIHEEAAADTSTVSENPRYTNTKYGFSTMLPSNIEVQEFDEGTGASTIVFENRSDKVGLQLFIVPYGEQTISRNQFLRDVPSGVRKNESMTTVAGIPAVAFESEDALMGKTQEVWLIHAGHLYEFTTYLELKEDLMTFLESVRFE